MLQLPNEEYFMVVTDEEMVEELGGITGVERRGQEVGEAENTWFEGVQTTEQRGLEVGDGADAALEALRIDDRKVLEDMIEKGGG